MQQRSKSPRGLDNSVLTSVSPIGGEAVSPFRPPHATHVAHPVHSSQAPLHLTESSFLAKVTSLVLSPSPLSPFSKRKASVCFVMVVFLVLLWVTFGPQLVDSEAVQRFYLDQRCTLDRLLEDAEDSTHRSCADSGSTVGAMPLRIVVAGMPRSMGTWLFNALRLIMNEVDPNLISGWYQDLEVFVRPRLTRAGRAYKSCCHAERAGSPEATCEVSPFFFLTQADSSLLAKVHKVPDWHRFSNGANFTGVHAVFATHRDLGDMVRSLRLQGNWSFKRTEEQIRETGFCYKKLPRGPPMTEEDWRSPDAWVGIAQEWVKCSEALRNVVPSAQYYPIDHDAMKTQPMQTLRRIADILAAISPDWTLDEETLKRVLRRLSLLKTPRCNPGHLELHPITHFHIGHSHTTTEITELERNGMAKVNADPVCHAWREQMGYTKK